jgi:hypothetical protein
MGLAAAELAAASGPPARSALPATAPAVIMSFTGAVHGYLDVCGCAKFPLGSIARRATQMSTFQRRWPTAAAFAVDAGNFSDLPGPAGAIKTRALVEAMNELGYRAAGIGARDLAFGPAALAELGSVARFPFLSANLMLAAQGRAWLPASHVVEAGGLRIGIVAAMRHDPLSSWALPDGTSLVTVDPIPPVARALAGLAGKADVVVLLASMPLEDARLVARRVPGIDLVVGGYGGQAMLAPAVEGTARILYLEDQGKFLGLGTIFRPSEPGARPTLEAARFQLGEDIGADARWEAFTIEAMARAQEADDAARRPAAPVSEVRFAGVGGCAGCHLSIVEQWSKTPHAAAWKTLVRGEKKAQASCIPCHVTGHGEPGGFVDERETPHLVGVGCEACHGPAAAHLADPARPYGKTGLASCTACHTAEMDPTFNYYQDRQLVMHGTSSP